MSKKIAERRTSYSYLAMLIQDKGHLLGTAFSFSDHRVSKGSVFAREQVLIA